MSNEADDEDVRNRPLSFVDSIHHDSVCLRMVRQLIENLKYRRAERRAENEDFFVQLERLNK